MLVDEGREAPCNQNCELWGELLPGTPHPHTPTLQPCPREFMFLLWSH